MSLSSSLNAQHRYEIQVDGELDTSWLHWIGTAKAHTETLSDTRQMTVFSDVLMDQAELVGLIRKLHGFGVVLISVRQV